MLRHILRQSRRGQQAKKAIFLSHRKGNSAPLLFAATLHFRNYLHQFFPCATPHFLNSGCNSKVSNFTFHQAQSQLNNHRKPHSSRVLQYTGSDTCGWSSSSFLPRSWMKGRELLGGASHSETGTTDGETIPEADQCHCSTGLINS